MLLWKLLISPSANLPYMLYFLDPYWKCFSENYFIFSNGENWDVSQVSVLPELLPICLSITWVPRKWVLLQDLAGCDLKVGTFLRSWYLCYRWRNLQMGDKWMKITYPEHLILMWKLKPFRIYCTENGSTICPTQTYSLRSLRVPSGLRKMSHPNHLASFISLNLT